LQDFRLARIELAGGNVEAARQDLDDAYKTFDPLLPPEHGLRVQVTVMRALIAKAQGDLPAAQHLLEIAEAAQDHLGGADPINLAIIRVRLAAVLAARGDLVGARHKLDASRALLESALLPEAVERVESDAVEADLEKRERIAGR